MGQNGLMWNQVGLFLLLCLDFSSEVNNGHAQVGPGWWDETVQGECSFEISV